MAHDREWVEQVTGAVSSRTSRVVAAPVMSADEFDFDAPTSSAFVAQSETDVDNAYFGECVPSTNSSVLAPDGILPGDQASF
jgi:hypothetical protein